MERYTICSQSDGIKCFHAASIVELRSGELYSVWYGGDNEGDDNSADYYSIFNLDGWSKPDVLWNPPGMGAGNPRIAYDSRGTLWAFLPVNRGGRKAWCMGGTLFYYAFSVNDGKSFSIPAHTAELDHILGKNKPLLLKNGNLLLPTTHEVEKSSVFVEFDTSSALCVSKSKSLFLPGKGFCIQPTIEYLNDGRIIALLRTKSGRIWKSYSSDEGKTFSEPEETAIPHNHSGIDLARLSNGKFMLAYNKCENGKRTPLNLALIDENLNFEKEVTIEDGEGEFSYPAVIQAKNGKVHLVYSYITTERDFWGASGTHIKHVVTDEHLN